MYCITNKKGTVLSQTLDKDKIDLLVEDLRVGGRKESLFIVKMDKNGKYLTEPVMIEEKEPEPVKKTVSKAKAVVKAPVKVIEPKETKAPVAVAPIASAKAPAIEIRINATQLTQYLAFCLGSVLKASSFDITVEGTTIIYKSK